MDPRDASASKNVIPYLFKVAYFHFEQIGSTWVVTAAHCVHDKSGEIIPARSLSIMLGLHDRGKYDQEPKRCVTYLFLLVSKKTFLNTNKFVSLLRVFK